LQKQLKVLEEGGGILESKEDLAGGLEHRVNQLRMDSISEDEVIKETWYGCRPIMKAQKANPGLYIPLLRHIHYHRFLLQLVYHTVVYVTTA
jgi:hypothetical protein